MCVKPNKIRKNWNEIVARMQLLAKWKDSAAVSKLLRCEWWQTSSRPHFFLALGTDTHMATVDDHDDENDDETIFCIPFGDDNEGMEVAVPDVHDHG